jgi:hypothetical protein
MDMQADLVSSRSLVRIYRGKMSSAPNVIREARMVPIFSAVNAAGYSYSMSG